MSCRFGFLENHIRIQNWDNQASSLILSGMELFDLVNQNDEVIGVTDRNTAHSERLLHRIVAIFVFNTDGELYVQVHKASGGLLDHSIGGHVRQHESYVSAAYGEAREELGIDQPLEEVSIFYSKERKFDHMIGLFTCVASADWRFTPNEEVEEILPMQIDDIRNQMRIHPEKFTGGFINTMNEYCRKKHLKR